MKCHDCRKTMSRSDLKKRVCQPYKSVGLSAKSRLQRIENHMNIGAYQKFTARVSLACEYGRRESKAQLLDRLRDALRQLAAEHHAHANGAKRAWHGVYPGHEEGCVCLLCETTAPQVA